MQFTFGTGTVLGILIGGRAGGRAAASARFDRLTHVSAGRSSLAGIITLGAMVMSPRRRGR